MALEATGGFTSRQIPQTQRFVPRARQSVASVRGKNHIIDEMRMSMQTLQRGAVAVLLTGQLPHDQGLIYIIELNADAMRKRGNNKHNLEAKSAFLLTARWRDDQIWVLGVGDDLCDPVAVPQKGAAQLKSLRHCPRPNQTRSGTKRKTERDWQQ